MAAEPLPAPAADGAPFMPLSRIGLIGLAVMGQNLARNIARHGISISVYNRTTERTQEFVAAYGSEGAIVGAESIQEFVASLERPRKIIMLVKAGGAVDMLIGQIEPFLQPGDILIDGGNSHFLDTRRRCMDLAGRGLHFIGSGVSGGEEGALNGPSLMPGGPRAAVDEIMPIWRAIAAQVDDGPCAANIGEDGSGHYVKMAHNGIEYGDMQLIAEAYDLLRRVAGLAAPDLADVFDQWNQGPLKSYLIEITAKIFRRVDPETGRPLVEMILDRAGQKGTGKWTAESALELGVPAPTLAAAVDARAISSFKTRRVAASRVLPGPAGYKFAGDRAEFVSAVRDALYASKICAYAQGMSLIQVAGREYNWGLDLAEISRIWKGGCIIRAAFLDDIKAAYRRDPALESLLLDAEFRARIASAAPAWRRVCMEAAAAGVPIPAMGASLAYYDSSRAESLPQNLTQAQRDFFGAHTYVRVDAPDRGDIHTEWEA